MRYHRIGSIRRQSRDPPMQFNLGRIYGKATGIYGKQRAAPQDDATAALWYRKAAEQNYAPAQFNLSEMYAEGSPHFPRDLVHHIARQWLLCRRRYCRAHRRERVEHHFAHSWQLNELSRESTRAAYHGRSTSIAKKNFQRRSISIGSNKHTEKRAIIEGEIP
jgi:hypothetical protein